MFGNYNALTCSSTVCSQGQLKLPDLVTDPEVIIFSVSCLSFEIFKVNAQLITFLVCNQKDVLVAEPIVSSNVAKTVAVVVPRTEEIHGIVLSFLKYLK